LVSHVLEPKQRIEGWFSRLRPGTFEIIGEPTDEYNCFAWAAGDTTRRWEPDPNNWYWPDDAPTKLTLDAFVAAYATLGYYCIDVASNERFYENIAIYVKDGEPSHAARQLPSGRWTSKLGDFELIEHDLDALEGNGPDEYGKIVQLMARPRTAGQSQVLSSER
jgi:hypothetical protein